jgi:hypothetical protein
MGPLKSQILPIWMQLSEIGWYSRRSDAAD